MVGIKDVARDAGVSAQTVSNCLNNPGIVKPGTRELVAASIAKLGYIPNASARRLRTQRSNTIAIGISPASTSRVYDRFLHALVTEADAHDIRVILYKTDSQTDEIRQFDALTSGGDVDSFVLTDTAHDDIRLPWLIERRQAFVLFGRPWGLADMFDPRVPWVDVDGRLGIAEMTQHLILTGRKRIGFIGWPGVSGTGDDRREGWRDALLTARMANEEELKALAETSEDEIVASHAAFGRLLERCPDLDAVVCVSDTIATGASMAVPAGRDIAITGFDNTDSAESLGLPTVAQPLAESAREIIRIIQSRLAPAGSTSPANPAPAPDPLHILLPPTLVLR